MTHIPKYQNLFFNENRTANTGNNLISNGKFNINSSGWIVDDYVHNPILKCMEYQWTYGCYQGYIRQENISLNQFTRYKFTFKYRAINKFNIVVRVKHMTDSAYDIIPEYIFPANTNSLYNTVSLDINVSLGGIYKFQIGGRATGNGDFGACNDTGNSTNGLFFDDVTLYEQAEIIECGGCPDTVLMDINKPIEFQLKGRKQLGSSLLSMTENPFNKITSTDLQMEFTDTPTLNDVFILYTNGYRILFIANNVLLGNYHQWRDAETLIVFIKAINFSNYKNNLEAWINSYLSTVIPITLTRTGNVFKLANMPSNSYISLNSITQIINITTINPAYFIGDNFHFISNKLSLQRTTIPPLGQRVIGKLIKDIYLESFKYYRLKFDYSIATPIVFTIKVKDSSNVIVHEESISLQGVPNTLSTDLRFNFDDTYNFEMLFDATDISNMQNDGIERLLIDNFSLHEIGTDEIVVSSVDCNGIKTAIPYAEVSSNDNLLFQLQNDYLPQDTFKIHLIIGDSLSTSKTYLSQNIKLIDTNNINTCNLNKYVKIQWKDKCMFKEIDYNNLPFMNELYLNGFIVRTSLDKKERIQFVNNDGSYSTIYDHSVTKSELRIGSYSIALHEVLERAFLHKDIYINDKRYYIDDSSIYTINSNNNGYFTARIELVEAGNEVVKVDCCC